LFAGYWHKGETTMQRYQIVAGVMLGTTLLMGAVDPGNAFTAFSSGTVLSQDAPDGVILVRAGGKNRYINVNRNVNRNANVNRNVNRNTNVNVRRNTNVNVNVGRPVRVWVPRPYYGTVIAGVALGTIIYVSAAGTAPPAPSSTLCWYWSDSAMTGGYWDYCR
jgi:hypothetical protein